MNEPQKPAATQPTEAVIKRDVSSIEYVPYGSQDKIRLTIAIVQNLIAVKTKSGKTCSANDALKFQAMCQARRLNPFEGDAYLIGYDANDGPSFSLITAHQTYLKRAELHPEFDGMQSGLIVREGGTLREIEGDYYDENQEVVGGWARVFFKNRKHPMYKRLRLARFRKPFGVWKDDAAGMICKCAEADALRSAFPTMLGGLYMREELDLPDSQPLMSKPIFKELPSPTVDIPTDPTAPEAQPEPSAPNPPRELPLQPETKPQTDKDRYLKAVKLLIAAASPKIPEGAVVGFCAEVGISDGSVSELSELTIEQLKQVHDHWADIAKRIQDARKAGSQ